MLSELLRNHLERKLDDGTRPTLEEYMMLYYNKPCVRVHPRTSLFVSHEPLYRGTVLVRSTEVIIVCNPGDFHLWGPPAPYELEVLPETIARDLLEGTTVIAHRSGKPKVTRYVSGEAYKRWKQDRTAPPYRWGGISLSDGDPFPYDQAEEFTRRYYDTLGGGGHCRVLTCMEEIAICARRSARETMRLARP